MNTDANSRGGLEGARRSVKENIQGTSYMIAIDWSKNPIITNKHWRQSCKPVPERHSHPGRDWQKPGVTRAVPWSLALSRCHGDEKKKEFVGNGVRVRAE
jgi:hypothetical protein